MACAWIVINKKEASNGTQNQPKCRHAYQLGFAHNQN
jgi:hypothetical protein